MDKHGIQKLEEIAHLGKADLHIHSCHSDGKPTVAEILDYVEEKTDLDVIAIADHDTMDGYFEAVELMKKKKYRFQIIPAEEVTSNEGHILGLFINKPIGRGFDAHTVLEKIKEQGGLAIAAHPFRHVRVKAAYIPVIDGIGLITLLKEKDNIDAVEAINGTPTVVKENIRAAFVNNTLLFKAETGGSDAHILEAIGKGYTLFEGKTVSDLKYALEHNQTQAMYGKWTLLGMFRYLFFFLPKGFRMLIYTALHGRNRKRPQIINVPKGWEKKKVV